ncbi:glutaredoxin [Friedmanniomyces endolithicus]|uniref:Glutaredoxin n=1 Tax=Friedmanniomyces endolithicus TaxID=329885 RepID=A0AAN6KYN3_9PEZI|nr:glutaredoxin [Friedmanniomyces endolithicus]KAK0963441.1 glutaredoxin [Friedmanniomyces endolithicus]KAK1010210.1 glutaredoxin [Friedmanniomyces endolithicus]KAK1047894.1 glutaredoxin [Friedmanniomyces endolithicus]
MNSNAPMSSEKPGPAVEQNQPTTAPAGTCTVTPINTESDFEEQTSSLPSSCLAVIYFHAPWAEPCKQMSIILSTLASTYAPGDPQRIAFFGLDAEEVSEVSEQYDVTQVPLVVLQKDGKVVESITGTDASKVRNAVEKHAGSPVAGNPGKAGLPPAQKVTKPAPSVALDDKPEDGPHTNGSSGGGLSKYAPDAKDPSTAPEYSSGETNGASHARLSELVKAAPVMLFMKGTPSAPQCGFSRQTVSMLREKGIRYGFFNILADDEVRQGLKNYSEWPTFPQVYVGGELVGGLDILKEEFENDPEFLREYMVQGKTGGPASANQQAQPA